MKRCTANHGVHQFYLDDGVWRCAHCPWFVYVGLARHLINRDCVCCECGKRFKLDEMTVMTQPQPKCEACSNPAAYAEKHRPPQLSPEEQEIAAVRMLEDNPFEISKQITAIREKYARLKETVEKKEPEKDEIEVIAEHAADCQSYAGGSCSCGLE